jgi:hypothetical protein
MNDDERCCGTGTCMINADGLCWCGQQWNGATMCFPYSAKPPPPLSVDAHANTEAEHDDAP